MVRLIFTKLLALNLLLSFGQTSVQNTVSVMCSTADSTIQVIRILKQEIIDENTTRFKETKYYIIYENDYDFDTIYLSSNVNNNLNGIQVNQIEQIQIDGKDKKEIHINWTIWELEDYIGGQTSWSEYRSYINHEIWNLDTKERLFSAVSLYDIKNSTTIHGKNEFSTKTNSFWSYDFSMDENGRISISNIKKSEGGLRPDNEEGEYIFKEGKYIKK